jgi:hypothetical protein
MKHVQFFEFEDQTWIPPLFRNAITQITQYNVDFFKIYDPISNKIDELLQTTGHKQIIDLCSGSSGPWPRLINKINSPAKVILTDKFPNLKKWEQVARNSKGKISYYKFSVDAKSVPEELQGIRTIFTGFHHFNPEDAKKILAQAVERDEPVAIFEFTERNFISMIRGLVLYILLPFLQIPFIRPKTSAGFLWTYLIPIIPVMHWWDGLISNLRTYSTDELWEIVSSNDWRKYHWKIGTEPLQSFGMKGNITYLIGYNPHRSQ